MNRYAVIGLSHKSAPTSLRERLQAGELASALESARGLAEEVVLVSTCNRFELYLHDLRDENAVYDWMAARARMDRDHIIDHSFVRYGRNACKHLFFVSSSLDSLVVGETQIRGQVKESYRLAQEFGSVGAYLHRLFQSALRVSKEISETTGVGRGSVSVAGAAADLAERIFGELHQNRVLVLGAGETAELLVTHLQGRGVDRFVILNRTPARAAELAARCDGESGGLERLVAELPHADIVATAAAADGKPLLDVKTMRKAIRSRRGRPVVALDIAVPRAIDPRVDQIDNVYRYDMDALAAVTKDALRHRRSEFLRCCSMIDSASLRLDAGARAGEAGPTIVAVEEAYRATARQTIAELERKLESLTGEEREVMRRSINRLISRLLHLPKRALRNSNEEEREMMRRVFAPPSGEDLEP